MNEPPAAKPLKPVRRVSTTPGPGMLSPGELVDAPTSWLGRYFFRRGSTAAPAMMRFLAVGFYLFWLSEPLADNLYHLDAPGFDQPQLIVQFFLLFVDEATFRQPIVIGSIWWATQGLGLLALVGLFTRFSLGGYAVGHLILIAHEYSYGEFHHPDALYVLFLLMLAFAPTGDCLSVDAWWRSRRDGRPWYRGSISRLALWPLLTIQLLLCLAYVDAGTSKLTLGGLHWFNGYTLQNYLLEDGLRRGLPWGVWLAQYRLPCIIMAFGAVAFELGFWLIMVPRLRFMRWPVLLSGVGMHMGIYILQGAPFFTFMIIYLTWVPWHRLPMINPDWVPPSKMDPPVTKPIS